MKKNTPSSFLVQALERTILPIDVQSDTETPTSDQTSDLDRIQKFFELDDDRTRIEAVKNKEKRKTK